MSLSDDLSLPISHSPPADGEFVASDSDTYTPPEVVDSTDAIAEDVVQMSPAPGDLSLPETPPVDSGAGPSEFDIVTGATPTSRFGEVCTDRRKAAAVLGGIALAVVLVVLLIISASSGDSSSTAGAALLVSGAPLQGDLHVQRQHRQHAVQREELHLEKTVDTASFAAVEPPLLRHYVCMYECGADEPKNYDPALVHTVGGCQTTPCSAFGVDYCGTWGGQRSEAFMLDHTSREVCERYVEKMTPIPVQQRAAAFHVSVTAKLNEATGDHARRALAAGEPSQMTFSDLRAALAPPAPAAAVTTAEYLSAAHHGATTYTQLQTHLGATGKPPSHSTSCVWLRII